MNAMQIYNNLDRLVPNFSIAQVFIMMVFFIDVEIRL
jgi:hypothetical protein